MMRESHFRRIPTERLLQSTRYVQVVCMRMLYSSLVLTLPSATQETPAALLNDFLLDVPNSAEERSLRRAADVS